MYAVVLLRLGEGAFEEAGGVAYPMINCRGNEEEGAVPEIGVGCACSRTHLEVVPKLPQQMSCITEGFMTSPTPVPDRSIAADCPR